MTHSGLTTSSVDEDQHQTVTTIDPLNRRTTVVQDTGTGTSNDPWVAYATTDADTQEIVQGYQQHEALGVPGFDFQQDLDQNGVITYPTGDATREAAAVGTSCAGTVDRYTYDGNGVLLKRAHYAAGSSTPISWTRYVGGLYELHSDGTYTKYYQGLGRTVAIRTGTGGGTVYYPLLDHLGSTVGLLDSGGNVVSGSKTWYWPYGGQRVPTGQNPPTQTQTDRLYTGQQAESGDSALGLYNYKARFYSTVLGRFVSADGVTSQKNDPVDLNRFGYVRDNPLRYSDPTGHCVGGKDAKCTPEIALNIAACAQSAEACAKVFVALGKPWDPDLNDKAHEFAVAAVKTAEFWNNFFRPDINPLSSRNQAALIGQYAHVINSVTTPEMALQKIEGDARLTLDKKIPNGNLLLDLIDSARQFVDQAGLSCAFSVTFAATLTAAVILATPEGAPVWVGLAESSALSPVVYNAVESCATQYG